MPKVTPAPTRSESAETTAPAKSVRALYAEQLAKFDASSAQIEKLRANDQRWAQEKQETIQTGAIDDDRKVQLVATLDVKRSMLPFAIQREEGHQRDAIAALNELYGPLTAEVDVYLNAVRDELMETIRANASIFCEEPERIDELVDYLFARTEYGRRHAELQGERPYGPLNDRGRAGFFMVWHDRAVALAKDWIACKFRAATVPTPDNTAS